MDGKGWMEGLISGCMNGCLNNKGRKKILVDVLKNVYLLGPGFVVGGSVPTTSSQGISSLHDSFEGSSTSWKQKISGTCSFFPNVLTLMHFRMLVFTPPPAQVLEH